jgi:GT2 family glycosyltransferase
VIIPTRDRVGLLSQCIESLMSRTTYPDYEVIVADNDSRDPETLAYFQTLEARGVRVMPAPGPFNFSRINNQAAAAATGEYLLLLNNDTEVTDGDWLTEMMRYAVQPDIGCVGARLWYPDRTLQHGGVILGILGMAGHAHKHLPQGSGGYFSRAVLPQQLSALTAACLLVRKSLYMELGGLDESLAVALNDIDFCLRVDAAGYRNVWTPYAELIHHESKSRGYEDTAEKRKRLKEETAVLWARWGERLQRDPFYSPHLTRLRQDFSIATERELAAAAPGDGAGGPEPSDPEG